MTGVLLIRQRIGNFSRKANGGEQGRWSTTNPITPGGTAMNTTRKIYEGGVRGR